MIKINRMEGFDPSDPEIKRLLVWVSCFFYKYRDLRKSNERVFERDLCYKLKMFLLSNFSTAFWNFFIGKRLNYVLSKQELSLDPKSCMELELDFPEYQKLTYKPKILLFQRRTQLDYSYLAMG